MSSMVSERTPSRRSTDAEAAHQPPERRTDAGGIEYVNSPTFRQLDKTYADLSIPRLCRVEPVERELRPVSLDAVETGLSTYLAELYRVPLLDPSDEYAVFRWMNYLKYRAARLNKAGDASNRRTTLRHVTLLLRRAREFRNRIVSANLRLVVSIAKKLVDRDNRIEDLISDGNLPLIRAVEIFDYERGTRFSTYATWAIRNSLFRATPKNRRRARRFLTGLEEDFTGQEDERNVRRGAESYQQEVQESVESLLSTLPERDELIVRARFGLNPDEKQHRFREIAEILGISTERVRQLLARSLDQLQEGSRNLAIEVA